MKDFPLVSVIISAYNAEKFLIPTLKSVLQQTYKNIEVLIFDDASRDNTYGLRKKITDDRIKRFRSEKNLGPYKGLNYLLDKAQGEYIAIQDHDDIWHSEKLEKQIDFLQKNKKYIWCGTKTLMYYESDKKWFEYFLWKETYYTLHPSLVFRNQWQRYPEDKIYMNDAYFQKKILCRWKKLIYNIDEVLTMHRVKSGAKNYSYKWFQYSIATLRTIYDLHPLLYGICIVGRETMRKLLYPVLQWAGKWWLIDKVERLSFMALGAKIEDYSKERLRRIGL